MLTWPFQRESSGDDELIVSPFFDEGIFKKCLFKLNQLEEDIYRNWDPDGHAHIPKPQVNWITVIWIYYNFRPNFKQVEFQYIVNILLPSLYIVNERYKKVLSEYIKNQSTFIYPNSKA